MGEHKTENEVAKDLRARYSDEVADLYLKLNDAARYHRKCAEAYEDERDELREENAELRAALAGGKAYADWQNYCNESWNKLIAERSELERKLAVAVEALEHYADPDLLCYQEEDIDENGFEGIMYYFRGVYPKESAFKGEGPWNFAQEALAKIADLRSATRAEPAIAANAALSGRTVSCSQCEESARKLELMERQIIEGAIERLQDGISKIKQDKPECEHEYELRQIFMEGRAVDSDYFCLKCGAPKP